MSALVRRGVQENDAPDVAQEVLLQAARSWATRRPLPGVEAQRALRGWLRTIVMRAAVEYVRRSVRYAHGYDAAEAIAATEPEASDGGVEQVEAAVVLDALRSATSDDNWRAWAAVEADAAQDAAKAWGIPANTVHNRARLARRDIDAALRRMDARTKRVATRSKVYTVPDYAEPKKRR
jgi:DNA-directed RNA polymerase specialized sigma24 family protein